MTLNPTEYDVIQDGRLEGLETIVTPSYEPPEGTEYSFPVVGQGVNSQQFQQMNLAMGDGVLITDDSEMPYVLEGHGSDAETNSKNTMILKVAKNTGRGEAVIRGFYHTLLADMELSFPAVTTNTAYFVALTYDPRREDEPQGPIRVEVHSKSIPRTFGRKHIVLHTVKRKPNQLLSQAEITTERRYVSPVITVSRGEEGLPDAKDVLYGTLGVSRSRSSGSSVIPGTGQLFEARGIHGWHNLLVGPWVNVFQPNRNGWTVATGSRKPMARFVPAGVQLKGHFDRNDVSNNTFGRIIDPTYFPNRTLRVPIATSGPTVSSLILEANGDLSISGGYGGSYISVDGITYPID